MMGFWPLKGNGYYTRCTQNMLWCVQCNPGILISPQFSFSLNSHVIWDVTWCILVQVWYWQLPMGYLEHVRMCPMGSWAYTLLTIALVFEFWCDLRGRMMCFWPIQKLATSPGVSGTYPDASYGVLSRAKQFHFDFRHHCTCFLTLMWFEVLHDVFWLKSESGHFPWDIRNLSRCFQCGPGHLL